MKASSLETRPSRGNARSRGTDQRTGGGNPMRWIMTAALAALCLVGAPAPLSAAEPIATTDGETPGLSLQVQELKVSNGTVMMKFTLANNTAEGFSPHTLRDQAIAKADG